jgi:ribbon-helix-helix protein
MSWRTQVTLTDEQYARLRTLSRQTGLSMSELVRRALDRAYGNRGLEALHASFGLWRDRSFDGKRYVERMRRGLGRRLRELDGRAG